MEEIPPLAAQVMEQRLTKSLVLSKAVGGSYSEAPLESRVLTLMLRVPRKTLLKHREIAHGVVVQRDDQRIANRTGVDQPTSTGVDAGGGNVGGSRCEISWSFGAWLPRPLIGSFQLFRQLCDEDDEQFDVCERLLPMRFLHRQCQEEEDEARKSPCSRG